MIQDITEQKQAEGKIRFQAELLASVEQAVIATDMSGHHLLESLCGKPFRLAGGYRPRQPYRGDRPGHQDPLRPGRSFAEHRFGQDWSGEFSVRRRDGSTILAEVSNSPVKDSEGKLIGIVSIANDITEEKRARAALMEEQRTLAVLNRTAAKLNAELDLTALLQAVIEAGVELTGAEFGALFGGGAGEGVPFRSTRSRHRPAILRNASAAARGRRRRSDHQRRGYFPLG